MKKLDCCLNPSVMFVGEVIFDKNRNEHSSSISPSSEVFADQDKILTRQFAFARQEPLSTWLTVSLLHLAQRFLLRAL
jgi:hypothetical protein